MNYKGLEQNIIDVIKEEQVKLGYRSEMIRLYYPLQSLNRLLKTDLDVRTRRCLTRTISVTTFCNLK